MPEGHTLHRLALDLTDARSPRRDDHGGEVYVARRTGLPCWVCGAKVRTELLAGRNLFECGRCQRRG